MSLYNAVMRRCLFALPPETAHRFAVSMLHRGAFLFRDADTPEILQTELWGKAFPSPVGLAAGFDKDAEAWRGLVRLGFGFLELGTVTPKPQTGNDKPRIFRDKTTKSVINRMGFPGKGLAHFKKSLGGKPHAPIPIGINIGKNKATEEFDEIVADYTACIRELNGLADYFVVNVSSPNTPGLRALQGRAALSALLSAVIGEKKETVPLLVKISPDLSEEELEDIAAVVGETRCDGVVIANTTLARPDELPKDFAAQEGGLSGPFLRDVSTAMIGRFYRMTEGKIPIIGVGGVSSGEDAYRKMRAGASLVQLYTAFVFEGPYFAERLNFQLAALLRKDGVKNCRDIIGIDSAAYMR